MISGWSEANICVAYNLFYPKKRISRKLEIIGNEAQLCRGWRRTMDKLIDSFLTRFPCDC